MVPPARAEAPTGVLTTARSLPPASSTVVRHTASGSVVAAGELEGDRDWVEGDVSGSPLAREGRRVNAAEPTPAVSLNEDPSSDPSASTAALDANAASKLSKLTRRASFNALASGIDFGARMVVEFVLNPILLRGLGSLLFGTWRVLWRLTGYLWATTGRSAQTLQSALANRLHSEDVGEKQRFVGAAVIAWIAFLPVLVVATALATWLLPPVLNIPTDDVWAVRWAIVLLGADAIALSLLTLPRSVLQGENLGYKRLGLSTALVVLNGVITAAAIWFGLGIVGVAGANLLQTVYTGALFWRITRRHVPWFGLARPSRPEVRWFLGLSTWFTVWKFVNQLMVAGDVLVLGAFASVEEVTVYSLSKFIPEAVLPLIALMVMGGIPGLGGIIGGGNLGRARRVRGDVMAMTWLVAVVAAAAILVWNRTFVTLWVGERYYAGDVQMLLIMVALVQLGMIRNDAFIIDLTLNVRAKVLVGLASSLVALGLAAVLIRAYDAGIGALCVGLILGRAILTIAYPWLVGRAIDDPLRQQVRAAVRPLVATAALFTVAFLVGREVSVGSWLLLVGGSVATALVATTFAALAGLTAAQRVSLVKRGRAIVGRSSS